MHIHQLDWKGHASKIGGTVSAWKLERLVVYDPEKLSMCKIW